ncbi:MAG: hypothetical protein R3D25_08930 [Geminicoccaceae bacterium]
MVGGEARDLERASPCSSTSGAGSSTVAPSVPAGPQRSLNNLLSAAGFAATIEVLQIGRRFGLEPALVLDVLKCLHRAQQHDRGQKVRLSCSPVDSIPASRSISWSRT